MRNLLLWLAILVPCVAAAPALALQADDTMQSWKSASPEDRAELLEKILGKTMSTNAGVSRCMNETSTTPGHTDLSIGDVAKVCAMPGNADQPV